jgi:hypothetical protein
MERRGEEERRSLEHTRIKDAELLENTRSPSVTAAFRLDAVPTPELDSDIPPVNDPVPVDEPLMYVSKPLMMFPAVVSSRYDCSKR